MIIIVGFSEQASNVNISQLRKIIKDDNAVIVDVRTREEVNEGRIHSDRWLNIPVAEVEAALKLAETDFKEKYGSQKPNKMEEIIFHCRSGKRSKVALTAALKQGFNKAKHFPGGWIEWFQQLDDNV